MRRGAIAQTRMGLREAMFYERLAPRLSLRVPEAHVVRFEDDEGGAFVILLEDLNESGCTVSSGPESPTPDQAAKALEDLAAMHVRFEDPSVRQKEAAWVPVPEPASDYGSIRLQEGLDHHRDKLTDAFAEMAEVYIRPPRGAPRRLAAGTAHGDPRRHPHREPLLRRRRRRFPGLGDHSLSTPLRDVSYFLNMCLSVADRRARETELIRHYLDVREALGGLSISFDEAWKTHRLQASYLAPASCQIVTFPEDVTPRRKKFAVPSYARAQRSRTSRAAPRSRIRGNLSRPARPQPASRIAFVTCDHFSRIAGSSKWSAAVYDVIRTFGATSR